MDEKQVLKETQDHIDNVAKMLTDVIAELGYRQTDHDKSKMKSPELEIFVEYTPKLENSTYGSDEYNTFLKEMKVALDHHYSHNRHHPEHFKNGIEDMNLLDLIEMLCDWKAATMRHVDGNVFRSLKINRDRFGMDGQLFKILSNTVDDLNGIWEENL